MNLWLRLLLSASCGCLFFLSVPTWDLWPLAWFAFVPLLFAVHDLRPGKAFLFGWVAGLATNLGGFYWIPHLLVRFGHLPQSVSVGLFVLLAAYQGLHWGGFALLVRAAQRHGRWRSLTLLAPPAMVAMELVTPFIFDWYLALSQAWNTPVIQVAELAGPLGVTFLIMLANGMIYDTLAALRQRRRPDPRPLIAGAVILLAALAFGQLRIHQIDARRAAAPKLKVGVVQGNIGIVQKGRARLAVQHHRLHLVESHRLQQRGAQLLVWPESAYPFTFDRDRRNDYPENDARQVMRGLRVPLLFGALSTSRAERYPYNTAYLMKPDGQIVGRFDKNYLLMFGEHIPFYEQVPSFKRWFPAASHFARGREVASFPLGQHRIGPMICYEDIIPAFGRRLARLEPNLLVNITNDAWFGRTAEPYQHMGLSVFRSVELRLDLVRAVNTGVSSVIDATGRVRAKTQSRDPAETPGIAPETLLEEVALMPAPATVYAAVGDLFGAINLLALLVLLWRARRLPGRRR